jgi:hypothetical protein
MEVLLHCQLDKPNHIRCGNWEYIPLMMEQQRYAAMVSETLAVPVLDKPPHLQYPGHSLFAAGCLCLPGGLLRSERPASQGTSATSSTE